MVVSRRLRVLAPAALLAAVMSAVCGGEPEPAVILIVIDSLRADRLHHAGEPRELSPRLDLLATESTRFTQAISAAPWTTPSVMSLFTGLNPTTHHVDSNDRALHPSIPTLAERFSAAGYATGAVMPALTLADHFGFDRGFDEFIFETQGHARVSGAWSIQQATDFLRRHRDRSFFLYVHLWDVHYNYNAPVPYSLTFQSGRPPGPGETDDVTSLIAFSGHADEAPPLPPDRVAWLEGQYAGEILFTDAQVGRLLDELERLELAERTVVVVTADHGEAFAEHGVLGHTVHLYDEAQHVPLLVRWPGRIAAGRTIDEPAGLVDVAPTLLELAGLSAPIPEFDGASRAGALLGREDPGGSPPPGLLMSSSRRSDLRGLWSPETVYIYDFWQQREELYDRSNDPGQQHNLAAERPEMARQWRDRLCQVLGASPAGEFPITPLDERIRSRLDEGLRSLGYLGRGDGQDAERPPRLDDAAREREAYRRQLQCPVAASPEPAAQ